MNALPKPAPMDLREAIPLVWHDQQAGTDEEIAYAAAAWQARQRVGVETLVRYDLEPNATDDDVNGVRAYFAVLTATDRELQVALNEIASGEAPRPAAEDTGELCLALLTETVSITELLAETVRVAELLHRVQSALLCHGIGDARSEAESLRDHVGELVKALRLAEEATS